MRDRARFGLMGVACEARVRIRSSRNNARMSERCFQTSPINDGRRETQTQVLSTSGGGWILYDRFNKVSLLYAETHPDGWLSVNGRQNVKIFSAQLCISSSKAWRDYPRDQFLSRVWWKGCKPVCHGSQAGSSLSHGSEGQSSWVQGAKGRGRHPRLSPYGSLQLRH